MRDWKNQDKQKELDNKHFWQRFARIYGPFMKSSGGLYEEICNEIRPFLNKKMNVLELACGSGQLSFLLAKDVRVWTAADFSENMIEEARKKERPGNLFFDVQDATNLPYSSGIFDAVVISNALHIMPYPEKALKEIERVLKPEGILFAPTFIHGEGAGFRLRVRMMELAGFHTFFQWDEKEFISYLEEHGYTVIKHKVMGGSLTPLCFAAAGKKDK